MPISGGKLTERAEQILWAVIESYMKSAAPVGSKRLQEGYQLPWSAATIRNELLALTRQGLLAQGHRSAGRVPTAAGMRYYVDFLLESTEITPSLRERMAAAFAFAFAFDGSETDPLYLLHAVSKLLSRISRHVSIAQTVSAGKRNFVIAGKENFLGQPEFTDSIKLKDLFHVLEQDEMQDLIFRQALTARPVHISIGAEDSMGPYRELFEDVTLLTSAFGTRDRAMGTVSVIGPKRMDYRRMIPLVDYTAQSVCRQLAQNAY